MGIVAAVWTALKGNKWLAWAGLAVALVYLLSNAYVTHQVYAHPAVTNAGKVWVKEHKVVKTHIVYLPSGAKASEDVSEDTSAESLSQTASTSTPVVAKVPWLGVGPAVGYRDGVELGVQVWAGPATVGVMAGVDVKPRYFGAVRLLAW